MKGFALFRRWRRDFRERRREFLERANRIVDLRACGHDPLVALDLGFGPELWAGAGPDVPIEPEWFTVRDARLVTVNGDSSTAVQEAERRGRAVRHVDIKF